MNPRVLLASILLIVAPASHSAETLHVATGGNDSSADPTDPGQPLATIGKAVEIAEAYALIRVGPGTYEESGIDISKTLGFIGIGPEETIIQGASLPDMATDRIFSIETGHLVSFDGLTIKNGVAPTTGPDDGHGGGIYNAGSDLLLNNVKLCGNRTTKSSSDGGGLFHHSGRFTISNSTIMDNHAALGGNGGGLAIPGGSGFIANTHIEDNFAGDQDTTGSAGSGGGIHFGPMVDNLTIKYSTISGNRAGNGNDGAGGSGGGISNQGIIMLESSLLHDNGAGNGGSGNSGANGGFGGALINFSAIDIINTTIIDNFAGDGGANSGVGGSGGAIDATSATGIANIRFCTVTGNCAGTGIFGDGFGGAFHLNFGVFRLFFDSTIVFGNKIGSGGGGPDVAGAGIKSLGNNLLGVDSFGIANTGIGDIVGTDPLLGPTSNNGGPTLTRLPSPSSVVRNKIFTANDLLDQRSLIRVSPTAIGSLDPDAVYIPEDPPPVDYTYSIPIAGLRFSERLELNQSVPNFNYQVIQGDTLSQLSMPAGSPGGPVPLTSKTPGSGGPLLFDTPIVGSLFLSTDSQKPKRFMQILITPSIAVPEE